MKNPIDDHILRIAIPSIISNITIPLLGLVDIAIVGHMENIAYIGAVSVGSMMFNLTYWLFSFLRMGTSGITSQLLGKRDLPETISTLIRSILIALVLAAIIIIAQQPLFDLFMSIIKPEKDIIPFIKTYFYIAIWGAPAVLCLNSITGWLIGMQNTRTPMMVSIGQNIINIFTSLTLVYGLNMKIEGVAIGTVLAQYAGLLIALSLMGKHYMRLLKYFQKNNLFLTSSIFQLFSVNRDIFFRTFCIVFTNLYFTSTGAQLGTIILSANTVILQFYLLFSYIMDGFAYAGEALGGRLYGAQNLTAFRLMIKRLFGWALIMSIIYTVLYAFFGMRFVEILTNEESVIQAIRPYIYWAWTIPLAGAAAFIWDGVFIGTTSTKALLTSAAVSTICFWAICQLTTPIIGNHGLWLAMITYLALRGIILTYIYLQSDKYKSVTD